MRCLGRSGSSASASRRSVPTLTAAPVSGLRTIVVAAKTARRQGFAPNASSRARLSARLVRESWLRLRPISRLIVDGDPSWSRAISKDRSASRNNARYVSALLKPQRCRSPAARYRYNSAIESQYAIDATLVALSKRTSDVRHTLTALAALHQLGLLSRRNRCPSRPLRALTS
jgi:hypothetical protein